VRGHPVLLRARRVEWLAGVAHSSLTGTSWLALAEGCWSAVLLVSTGPLLQSLAGRPIGQGVISAARVLGIRQLVRALLTARRPTRRILEVGAAVDALHAGTMVAGAAANVGPRRLTMASAATAGAFTAAALAQSRRR
jgi:hypothetical protein